MQFNGLTPKLRELTDLVWVKSLTRQGQQLDLHTISSHFTQFWRNLGRGTHTSEEVTLVTRNTYHILPQLFSNYVTFYSSSDWSRARSFAKVID